MKPYSILFAALLLTSCTQVNLLNEDLFFNRVSKGFGIWQVTAIEDLYYGADGILDSSSTDLPNDVYYQFYLRSEVLSITTIENEYMAVYFGTPDAFTRFEYFIDQSYNDRLTLYNYHTYTILDEKKNSFTLQRIVPDYNTSDYYIRLIRLERCESCTPWFNTSIIQQGG